jgi:hypothetical protein
MPRHPHALQSALDEVRFGPSRILSVRDSMPTAREAEHRVEQWLRTKQVERAGEVLVITGRGAGSVDNVPVIRGAVQKLLTSLRRRGVVSQVEEHTPGSFVVRLAPMRALFEATRRHRDPAPPVAPPPSPVGLQELEPATRDRLRALAIRSLESLGLQRLDPAFVADEMERQFGLLARGVPEHGDRERWLRDAIERALEEFENELR